MKKCIILPIFFVLIVLFGWSNTSNGEEVRSFFYSDGTMTDIGTLPGKNASEACDINNSGQIVGHSRSTVTGDPRAFSYLDGTMTDLGTLPGMPYSYAKAINDDGQIVGYSAIPYTYEREAFLYYDGQMTGLGTLGGATGGLGSTATDINDDGHIVGYSTTASGQTHAFLYSDGEMTDLAPCLECDLAMHLVSITRGKLLDIQGTGPGRVPFYTLMAK